MRDQMNWGDGERTRHRAEKKGVDGGIECEHNK